MDLKIIQWVIDLALIISAIWMIVTVRGVGGILGRAFSFITIGALVTGGAHLLATLEGSFFPFGGGPRTCIGDKLFWMEGILILASLAQRFKFHSIQDKQPGLKALMTLRPSEGLQMNIKFRN